MAKITIVVFCYRGEEEILPMSLGRAHAALPEAQIHLFDDDKDPLRPDTVAMLKERTGCTYRTTTFDRQRNLNGKECVVGELSCMLQAMDEDNNKEGYVLKMDPDTFILRPNLFLDAIEQGAKWVSHNSMKGHFAGMFYAIHRDILEVVYNNAQVMTLPEHCAEDETIGALCYIAAAQGIYSWTDVEKGDGAHKFAALPIQLYGQPDYWGQVIFCSRVGHVLTLGNSGLFGMTKSYQTVCAKDLLSAFYHPDKALKMLRDPKSMMNVKTTPLQLVNIQANKERGKRLEFGDTILRGIKTTPDESTLVWDDNTGTLVDKNTRTSVTPMASNTPIPEGVKPPEVPQEDGLTIIPD